MTQEEQSPQQVGIQSNSGGDINFERSQVTIAGRDMHFHSPLSASPPIPLPAMTPTLPAQRIIGRDNILKEIYNQLWLKAEEPPSLSPMTLTLQGMPGLGKTTLAIALGHSKEVARYLEGVLWATLGPGPQIRLHLQKWGQELGINLEAARDEQECSERLRPLLARRQLLLVIDDIWRIEDALYFNIAGPRCRTMVTTRGVDIAHALATEERTLLVDLLSPEDSVKLLRSMASAIDEKTAHALCERLEYLPLALVLAGGLLADESGVPSRMKRLLDELLERSNDAALQLAQQEKRPGLSEERPSLRAILGMSVERLSKTDRQRFAWLSYFGAQPLYWEIDEAMNQWQCSQEEAEDTISRFIRRGLVMRRDKEGKYWMHTLLAEYAAEIYKEMEG